MLIPLFLALILSPHPAEAALCKAWGAPKPLGKIDHHLMPEASGLAVSARFPGRLYHVNDRGHTPTVYVSDHSGKVSQEIRLPELGAEADTESLGYGPCGKKTCVYIGDIGDNSAERASISVAWIEEQETFRNTRLTGRVELKYPGGPRNAEGFFVHPSGDLVLFTKRTEKTGSKQKGKKWRAISSEVYLLPAASLAKGKGTFVLEKVGELDVPAMLGDQSADSIVTGASASSDGRVLLLTYTAAIELLWKPGQEWKAASGLKKGRHYNVIPLSLPHQEAIEFLADRSGFLVTSEKRKRADAPIVEVRCGG